MLKSIKRFLITTAAVAMISASVVIYFMGEQLSRYKKDAEMYEANMELYEKKLSKAGNDNYALRLKLGDLRDSKDSMLIELNKIKKKLKTHKDKPGDRYYYNIQRENEVYHKDRFR